ncbi:MAG: hypothetical protein EBZ77_10370, partial [Chitinophagia bacterium]|nr:hypothetical protein [Chitinophagia bacterium]
GYAQQQAGKPATDTAQHMVAQPRTTHTDLCPLPTGILDRPNFMLDVPAVKRLPLSRVTTLVEVAGPGFYKKNSSAPLVPVGGRAADILYVVDDMRLMRY